MVQCAAFLSPDRRERRSGLTASQHGDRSKIERAAILAVRSLACPLYLRRGMKSVVCGGALQWQRTPVGDRLSEAQSQSYSGHSGAKARAVRARSSPRCPFHWEPRPTHRGAGQCPPIWRPIWLRSVSSTALIGPRCPSDITAMRSDSSRISSKSSLISRMAAPRLR